MDKQRNRTGHNNFSYYEIQEELEYNIGRKEDLKAEVRKLEKHNKAIRELNWKNATAQMKTERELGEFN